MNDKGEVHGEFSISIERGKSVLKKVASVRMLHQPHDNHNIVSYPLQKRVRPFISPPLCFTFTDAIPGKNPVSVNCIFSNVTLFFFIGSA